MPESRSAVPWGRLRTTKAVGGRNKDPRKRSVLEGSLELWPGLDAELVGGAQELGQPVGGGDYCGTVEAPGLASHAFNGS